MCGICGFYGFEDKKLIQKMCSLLIHRGPDDEGFFNNKNITLGVRRLSIIDLTGGHQPVHNEDESIWIVFNGEIYNYLDLREELIKKGHRFYTESDTEVIVHSYEEFGLDCVKKLRGDFAFSIWDSNKNRIMLARDRLGVSPLYYMTFEGKMIFASEIKAILECQDVKKEIDFEALHYFLTFQYIPSPLTIFKNIRKLSPGHIAIMEKGTLNIKKYWDVEGGIQNFSEKYYKENILKILQKSIKIRLMSEVPLGVYLSGGLDSSTITALASKMTNEPLRTFSIGTEDSITNELNYARIISEKFETEHQELIVDSNSLMKNIDKIFWHMDEPNGDTAIVPEFFLSEFAKPKVTVILSGGGSDELFGGYLNYKNVIFFHNLKKYLPSLVRKPLPKIAGLLTHNFSIKEYANFISSDNNDIIYKSQGYLFYYDKPTLYSNSMNNLTNMMEPKNIVKNYFFGNKFDIFHKLAYIDLKMFVPDNCLNHSDRMGYAHSVEVRVPFLDHFLVEFAFQIPSKFKIKNNVVKYILKQAVKSYLPQDILRRKKLGFPAPSYAWFSNKDFKDYVQDVIKNCEIIKKYFKKEKISYLFENSNRFKESHQLFGLTSLAFWYKNFLDKT